MCAARRIQHSSAHRTPRPHSRHLRANRAKDVAVHRSVPDASSCAAEDAEHADVAGTSSEDRAEKAIAVSRVRTTVQLLPSFIPALAAIPIGVTLTFATRHVSGIVVAVTFALSVATIIGAGIWSWYAVTWLARDVVGDASATPAIRRASSRAWWMILSIDLAILGCLALVVFSQGVLPIPNFGSVYDGTDPLTSDCSRDRSWDPASLDRWNLIDVSGERIGEVSLRAAYSCSTIWPAVTYDKPLTGAGKSVRMTMVRPKDGATAVFRAPARGQLGSVGNMLYNNLACARAEVEVIDQMGNSGPKTITDCIRA